MNKETGSIPLKAESNWYSSLTDAEYECQIELDVLFAQTLLKLEREGKEYIGSSGGPPTVVQREINDQTEFKVSSEMVVNWKYSILEQPSSSSVITLSVSMTFEENYLNWSYNDKEISEKFKKYWNYISDNLSEHLDVLNKDISINEFENIERTEQDHEVTIKSYLFVSGSQGNEAIQALFDATIAKYAFEEQKRIQGSLLAYAQAAISVANMISGGFSLESPLSSIGSLPGLASIQLSEITDLLTDISGKLDDIENAIKELPRQFAVELTKNRIQGYYEKTSGNLEEANVYLLINDLDNVFPIASAGIGNCRTIWTALQTQAGTNPGFSASTSLSPFLAQLAQTFTYSVRYKDSINNRDTCKSATFHNVPILKNVREEMIRSTDFMKNKLAGYQPKIAEFPRIESRIQNGKLQNKLYFFDEVNGSKFISKGYMDMPDRYNAPKEYEGLCYSTGPDLSKNCSLIIYEKISDGRIRASRYSTTRLVKYPRTLSRLKRLIDAEVFRNMMLNLEPGIDEVRKAFLTKTVEVPPDWCQ